MIIISDIDTHIIESLARYKFLTTSQMIRLGISKDRSNLHKRLLYLREQGKPLISCVKFDGRYKMRGLEFIYFLSKRGIEALLELGYEENQIKRPKGKVFFPKQYQHRTGCIDIQIALYQWAEREEHVVELYDSYFDKIGSTRKAKYRSKTAFVYNEKAKDLLISDGVALVSTGEEKEIFCVELHNGKQVTRAIKQIYQYIQAMELGTISDAFDLQKANKVLFVFEFEQTMTSVMREFSKLVENEGLDEVFKKYFLFGSYDDVVKDFGKGFRKS